MIVTIYYGRQQRKTVQLSDDEDLTEFKKWAAEQKLYYAISKFDKSKNIEYDKQS